jgi:hypothetical protein
LFKRSAKARVNISGMCWTMTMPGQAGGMACRNARRASVPPVEAPMAIILSPVEETRCAGPSVRTTSAVFRGATGRGDADDIKEHDGGFVEEIANAELGFGDDLDSAKFES